MNADNRKALARHIGAALCHARAAQEINLNGGSAARIVRELEHARLALADAERFAERSKGAS